MSEEAPTRTGGRVSLVRLAAFAGGVSLLAFWIERAWPALDAGLPWLGVGWGVAVAIAGTFTTLAAFVWGMIRGGDDESWKLPIVRVLNELVADAPLTVLFVVDVALLGLTSTVTVLLPERGADASVELSAASGDPFASDGGEGSVRRFLRIASPFGSVTRLEVEGYEPHEFLLFPIVGSQFRPEADLRPLPTLLVRVPRVEFRSLKQGSIEVFVEGEDEPRSSTRTSARSAAVSFGPAREVSPRVLEGWVLDLILDPLLRRSGDSEFTPEEARLEAMRWARPTPAATPMKFDRDLSYVARFRVGDQVMAEAAFTFSTDEFQDLLLSPIDQP